MSEKFKKINYFEFSLNYTRSTSIIQVVETLKRINE